MRIPPELKYTESHMWAYVQDNGIITIGITACANDLLGNIVSANVNAVGQTLAKDSAVGYVEGGRGVSEVILPVDGEILVFNPLVAQQPDLIGDDPYGDGWIIQLKPTDGNQVNTLLSAEAYDDYCCLK